MAAGEGSARPGDHGVVTHHLVVKAKDFATTRFWDALNRLADREGHEGHARFMVGSAQHLDRYEYQCHTCNTTVAEFVVTATGPPEAAGREVAAA